MRFLKLTFLTSLFILLIIGCKQENELKQQTGFVAVNGGKVWYRVTGNGSKTPILMLHGGPGYPSHYFNPLLEIGKERPVITFDQLGCGRSDRITDTTLMTVDSYIEQTKELLDHLGVKEFYLYGHSWGTMLGTDYYLKHPEGIKALILASPCLSVKKWVSDADSLISTLPDSVSVVLRNSVNGVSQDSLTSATAIEHYFANFYHRKNPQSADLDSAGAQMGLSVYVHMWGTNEFISTGNLKNYDRTTDLNNISVPTLYVTGEFDAAPPSTVKYYQSLTPNSKLVIIPGAGHMTMHDNPAEDIKVISEFLNVVDNN
jgi:proline iminopeptidase